jgi:hypothetical protein
VRGLTAHVATLGPFWGDHGWPNALADTTVTLDTTRQHIEYSSFGVGRRRAVFDIRPAARPVAQSRFSAASPMPQLITLGVTP